MQLKRYNNFRCITFLLHSTSSTSASETSSLPRSLEPALPAVAQTLSCSNDPSIEMDAPAVIVALSGVVPQGPFGGAGGTPFYDGVGDIVRITITYTSEVVWSVQVSSRQKTSADVFNAARHGSKNPLATEKILDFQDGERLLRVEGTFSQPPEEDIDDEDTHTDVVTSLTFITTKDAYGPYGAVEGVAGQQFQSSSQGKVVGFFGRSGKFIDAFGTFTDFSHSDTSLKPNGPWGGNGGSAFYDARADKIKQVDVGHDRATIISLDVTYDRGSQGFETIKHGGDRGTTTSIVFENDEYLAQVTGTIGLAFNLTLVTSLRFITNKKVYGPFGHASGNPFQTAPHTQIVGFYGRSGNAIDQLGAFVGGAPSPLEVTVAHFGGNGGDPFYEGRGKISQIAVTYLKDQLVTKLQVTYLQDGGQFVGALHGKGGGGMNGISIATIRLNSPDEYLVQVKGTHGKHGRVEDMILSIEFITNKNSYGPYGDSKSGKKFDSPIAGPIVSLFGRSAHFLDQIGVICFSAVMA